MAAHSSVLGRKVPWIEEPGGLQSMGLHRIGHNWRDFAHFHACWYDCLDYSDSIERLSCNSELHVLPFWYSFSKLFWLFWVLCLSISVEILLEFWCRLHQVYKSSGKLCHLKNYWILQFLSINFLFLNFSNFGF